MHSSSVEVRKKEVTRIYAINLRARLVTCMNEPDAIYQTTCIYSMK